MINETRKTQYNRKYFANLRHIYIDMDIHRKVKKKAKEEGIPLRRYLENLITKDLKN